MFLILEDESNKIESYFFLKSFLELEQFLLNLNENKRPLKVILHSYEIRLNCYELMRIKIILSESNILFKAFHTNFRESLISAKSIKINSIYGCDDLNDLIEKTSKKERKNDFIHLGMVRSGDKISSNGNLIIIGDVNPGGQILAKRNIYVWGKLSGIAFAGLNGDNNCTISALYLNPLQLRINETIAIGPKEKPINYYPEVASLDNSKIIIQPLIVSS